MSISRKVFHQTNLKKNYRNFLFKVIHCQIKAKRRLTSTSNNSVARVMHGFTGSLARVV